MKRAILLINEKIEEWLIIALLANIVTLIFVQVCMRYLFKDSLSWSEELVIWSFIWFLWVGVSYGFKTRKHICVTAFVDLLPNQIKNVINILISLVILWFMASMLYFGYKQMMSPFISRQLSVVLYYPFTDIQISMQWLYASLPVGALLGSVRLVQNITSDVREMFFSKPVEKVIQ